MTNVSNAFLFKKNKEKASELKALLKDLDLIGDMLYSNLRHDLIWDLIQEFEHVRVKYYCDYAECSKIVNLKGKK